MTETRIAKSLAVESVITALGLAPCRDIKVCRISGGQAKRVNMCVVTFLLDTQRGARVFFFSNRCTRFDPARGQVRAGEGATQVEFE